MDNHLRSSADTLPSVPAAAANQDENEQLLTTADICGWFQVAEPTLRTWVRNGIFPKPMKLGQLSRWPRRTVEYYLADKQAKAEATAANRSVEDAGDTEH